MFLVICHRSTVFGRLDLAAVSVALQLGSRAALRKAKVKKPLWRLGRSHPGPDAEPGGAARATPALHQVVGARVSQTSKRARSARLAKWPAPPRPGYRESPLHSGGALRRTDCIQNRPEPPSAKVLSGTTGGRARRDQRALSAKLAVRTGELARQNLQRFDGSRRRAVPRKAVCTPGRAQTDPKARTKTNGRPAASATCPAPPAPPPVWTSPAVSSLSRRLVPGPAP